MLPSREYVNKVVEIESVQVCKLVRESSTVLFLKLSYVNFTKRKKKRKGGQNTILKFSNIHQQKYPDQKQSN